MFITYSTKAKSPKGTLASREFPAIHLSALKTSYIYNSLSLFAASSWKASGVGAKSVYLYPNISSLISPVKITFKSVFSLMYLHKRYIPTLALTVVISQVSSCLTTASREPKTSSLVIITSVCSVPKKSATSLAYFKSIGSFTIPIAKVLIGFSCAL